MSEGELPDGPRRLVVIAVDEYGTEDKPFTEGVQAQVETVTGWLADPGLDVGRRFEVVRPGKLQGPQDLRDFLSEQDLSRADWDETLVVYITGHGLRDAASRRHYLTFPGTYQDPAARHRLSHQRTGHAGDGQRGGTRPGSGRLVFRRQPPQ